ncbi:3-hydroxyacyl-CoA dehydrogenase [Nocardioides flavescens]|uniref:3-hydroxyacyl-CoA dehydrogenase n=1 Tax=Nocardioides flavescens TaxID=2691959 RepID=A0A6L7EY21_9ACTN|nr:3-hydroxyacyl-CoA dehydrogenase [Nocardioides flavescens]
MSGRRGPVAVVGAGLVGLGWVVVWTRAGHEVRLVDTDQAALDRAGAGIAALWSDVESGPVPETITMTTDLAEAVRDVVHVQECVVEDPEVKARVFAQVAEAAPATAVIASSTSALVPSSFTADVPGRERTLVAHPFNPPHLHTAVELVPAPWTSAEAMGATRRLLEDAGMEPIELTEELDGFVVNRLQSAMIHEAFRLLDRGVVGAGDLDRAVRGALAPRWLTLGVVETIDLNAPLGIEDYVARYGPMYARLAEEQREPVDWQAVLDAGLAADRAATLPREELDQRRRWRDGRLASLKRHLEGERSAD